MSERSWEAFARHMRKYEDLHSSKDFRRRKGGLLERFMRWLRRILKR